LFGIEHRAKRVRKPKISHYIQNCFYCKVSKTNFPVPELVEGRKKQQGLQAIFIERCSIKLPEEYDIFIPFDKLRDPP